MINPTTVRIVIENLRNNGFTTAQEKLLGVVLAHVPEIQQCEIIEILELTPYHPDFCETMNRHLAELPDDWRIFAAGYIWCSELPEENENTNRISELIRRNAQTLCGTQCLVLRSGEWRNTLTNDMRHHWFYGYKRKKGFDMNLAQWCRATNVPFYFAAQSFVGQGDGISLINGKRKRRMGLWTDLNTPPPTEDLYHLSFAVQ